MPVYIDYVVRFMPVTGTTGHIYYYYDAKGPTPVPMPVYLDYVAKGPYGGLEVGIRPQLRRPSLHHSCTAWQLHSRRPSRPNSELVFGVCGIFGKCLLFCMHVFAVVQHVQSALGQT